MDVAESQSISSYMSSSSWRFLFVTRNRGTISRTTYLSGSSSSGLFRDLLSETSDASSGQYQSHIPSVQKLFLRVQERHDSGTANS
jgi:hypothetical protein